jgi:hypothetical protein
MRVLLFVLSVFIRRERRKTWPESRAYGSPFFSFAFKDGFGCVLAFPIPRSFPPLFDCFQFQIFFWRSISTKAHAYQGLILIFSNVIMMSEEFFPTTMETNLPFHFFKLIRAKRIAFRPSVWTMESEI